MRDGSVPSLGFGGKAKAAAGTAVVMDGDGLSAAVLGLGLVLGRPRALFWPPGWAKKLHQKLILANGGPASQAAILKPYHKPWWRGLVRVYHRENDVLWQYFVYKAALRKPATTNKGFAEPVVLLQHHTIKFGDVVCYNFVLITGVTHHIQVYFGIFNTAHFKPHESGNDSEAVSYKSCIQHLDPYHGKGLLSLILQQSRENFGLKNGQWQSKNAFLVFFFFEIQWHRCFLE